MQRGWRPTNKASLTDQHDGPPAEGHAKPLFAAKYQNKIGDSSAAPPMQMENSEYQYQLEMPLISDRQTASTSLKTSFHPSFVLAPGSFATWASYQEPLQQPDVQFQANQFVGQSSNLDSIAPHQAFHNGFYQPLPIQQDPPTNTCVGRAFHETATEGFNTVHGLPGRIENGNSASRRSSGASSSPEWKRRKKVSPSDKRWSRRYTWPEDHHRAFMAAIFDVGLQEATTSILVQKVGADSDLTTQRVSSVLQSLRSNNLDVKALFESSDSLLSKSSCQGQCADQKELIRGYDKDSNESLNGCRIVVNDLENHEATAIPVPDMTEVERKSAAGQAMGHLIALVLSLKQKVILNRALVAKEKLTYAALADLHNHEDLGEKAGRDIGLQQAEDVSRSQACQKNLVQVMQRSVEAHHQFRSLKEQEFSKYQSSSKATQWDYKKTIPQVRRDEVAKPARSAEGETSPVEPIAEDQGIEPAKFVENDDSLDLGDLSDEKFFEFLINN